MWMVMTAKLERVDVEFSHCRGQAVSVAFTFAVVHVDIGPAIAVAAVVGVAVVVVDVVAAAHVDFAVADGAEAVAAADAVDGIAAIKSLQLHPRVGEGLCCGHQHGVSFQTSCRFPLSLTLVTVLIVIVVVIAVVVVGPVSDTCSNLCSSSSPCGSFLSCSFFSTSKISLFCVIPHFSLMTTMMMMVMVMVVVMTLFLIVLCLLFCQGSPFPVSVFFTPLFFHLLRWLLLLLLLSLCATAAFVATVT
jgi:hypothetical protein